MTIAYRAIAITMKDLKFTFKIFRLKEITNIWWAWTISLIIK